MISKLEVHHVHKEKFLCIRHIYIYIYIYFYRASLSTLRCFKGHRQAFSVFFNFVSIKIPSYGQQPKQWEQRPFYSCVYIAMPSSFKLFSSP